MTKNHGHAIKKSAGETIFDVFNFLLMACLMFLTFYPILYVVFASFSDPAGLVSHSGALTRPISPATLVGYERTLRNPNILLGYRNTLVYLVGGTCVSMVLTSLGAFVLTRKHFMPRNVLMGLITVTMFLSGGLIPLFFVLKSLGIYDTGWAMILPYAVSTHNLIILRTFFSTLPDTLEESAVIDGANDWHVFTRITLPLSKPALAVICLYYAVGLWNSWFPALVFMRDRSIYPLQMFLREILILNTEGAELNLDFEVDDLARELVKYCTIVISTVPILVIYPFLQKYFVKGVMIGAIKG